MGGVKPGNEIPLLTSSFYLLNDGGTAGAGRPHLGVGRAGQGTLLGLVPEPFLVTNPLFLPGRG